ncbi:MAG: NADPH-dependent oxidoreductase [Solibacillus sp.]
MNNMISQLTTHTSIRQYEDKVIPQQTIDAILTATQQAPSWINGQQMSIIRVTDQTKRTKLQEFAGNQSYVGAAPEFWVFCLDFYRTAKACEVEGKPFAVHENIDLLFVGATDVGIALGTAVAAAESFGLGTVAIGGVRRDAQAVIDLLELPSYVYPVSGLCLGYPVEAPAIKPRLPQHAVVFENTYNNKLNEEIARYNETFSSYMIERTNGANQANWTSGVAAFYAEPFYRGNSYADAEPILKAQGFLKK